MTFLVTEQPWHADAACRTAPPSTFYVEKHAGSAAAAKAICAGCPSQAPCLNWAINGGPEGTGEHHGVWAGTTPRERSRIRAAAKPRRRVAECGTVSGYSRHTRSGTPKCDACREAWALADRERKAAQRAAVAA